MAKDMERPTLPLLPDLEGEVSLEEGLGLRQAAPDFLGVLASTMDAPEGAVSADVLGAAKRSAAAIAAHQEDGGWRGLIALVLLWDTWADTQALLNVQEIRANSAFTAMILSARRPADRLKPLHLVTLSREGKRAALGIVHARLGIVPAATPTALADLLPERVTWYDREACVFTDPVIELNERDRATLIHRLKCLNSPVAARFASELLQEGMRVSRAMAAEDTSALEKLAVRTLTVCGMADLPGLSCREDAYAEETAGNPLLRALGADMPRMTEQFPPQLTWLWEGKPFARTSMTAGYGPAGPEDEQLLRMLAQEQRMLESSAAWQRNAARRLSEWLAKNGRNRGFSGAGKAHLEALHHRLEQGGIQAQGDVTLKWPWSADTGAASYLVRSVLGEAYEAGAMHPFADKLTLLPDAAPDALGDPTLCISCMLPIDDTGMPTMALPPLSAELARIVTKHPECLMADRISMRVTEMGAVEASIMLRGRKGDITFVRVYGEDDIVLLQPEETPTVAVWPSVAFPADQWKAYHVYTHGHGLTVSTLRDGEWASDDEHLWSVVRTAQFPGCMTVHRDGLCLGALVNQLPVFKAEHKGNVVAALDLGMSGTAVALHQDGQAQPMQLPCLVRTLLHGSHPAPFDKEFLPAQPLGGILPSLAAMMRETEEPQPLVDGHTGSAEQLDFVHTSLKWGVEGPDRKACLLHLHQTMLTASLAAKMNGAQTITWRMALPSDLSPAQRKSLAEGVRSLASIVARESSLPLSALHDSVRCVDADRALAAYFKSSGYQRGGFLSMDVGGGGASLMLWLRGMSRPSAVTHLPLGIHGMLLHTLMQQSDAFEQECAGLMDAAAQEAVKELCVQLRAARASRKAFGKCMLLLDQLIAQHGVSLQTCMNEQLAQGRMSLWQSLLLCGFAWLMTVSGLQLERAWQDTSINDHLPMEVPICLAGRGSLLLTELPDTLKMRLTRFLRLGMSADNCVRQVQVMVPGMPKMETVLGCVRAAEDLLDTADAPTFPDDRLPGSQQLLLRRFLMAFYTEFPLAFQRLWPNLVGENSFTEAAEMRMQSLCQMHPEPSAAALALCLEELRDSE